MRKDSKSEKIMRQVRLERAARRQVQIELQLPQVVGKVWDTHKKDKTSRKQVPNTLRRGDYDND